MTLSSILLLYDCFLYESAKNMCFCKKSIKIKTKEKVMKKLLLAGLIGISVSLVAELSAAERDTTVNVYGVGAKVDANQDSSAGAGVMFDSEAIKVKLEGTSDFFKSAAVLKFNPFVKDWYFKVGLNYINQKMYSPVDTSTRVNQYSGALATGYMISNDFYAEIGGSYTQLDGDVFGDYEIKDETTSLAYLEVAKRWESSIGTIDTTANGGEVFHEYRDNEFSYGLGVDYYPMNNAKLSYTYQHEENNIANTYAAQYSFLFVEYADNISLDTYQVNAGVKVAFDDLFDISTYRAPTNIKSHLSELHRFESITFATNMDIQSSAGVQKTQAAIDRDAVPDVPANTAPTWTASSYDTGITVDDANDDPKTIKDLTAVSSDAEGDSISYSIVSISVPGQPVEWQNSIYIENGVLKVHNLLTNDPETVGDVIVTVRATADGGSNDATVQFHFNDVN